MPTAAFAVEPIYPFVLPKPAQQDGRELPPDRRDQTLGQIVTGSATNPDKPAESTDSKPVEDPPKTTQPEPVVSPPPSQGMITSEPGQEPLSIAEAVRIALSQNKMIAVIGHIPQEVGTSVSAERAVFDPVFEAGIRGGSTDSQFRNFINTGGVLPGGLGSNAQDTDFLAAPDRNLMSISKLLETGAVVEAGVYADYIYDAPVGDFTFLNPAWGSALNLSVTQPLGRGMGSEFTTAPLRIARANEAVASEDFRAAVNMTLRDVQLAYWDWKLAQRNYLITQDAVDTAKKTLDLQKEAIESGEGTLPDFEQAGDQWQRFRIDAATARNDMNKARITLVQIMGLPLNNITYGMAIDEPITSISYDRSLGEASALSRPEVQATTAAIRAAELEARRAVNALRPDIDMRVDYGITGLERNLDDSISTLSEHRFDRWLVQFEYRRAAGLRAECAEVRRARLRLSRALADRDRVQQDILAEVARSWEDLITAMETLKIQDERVETARAQVKGRDNLFKEGEGSLDLKIRAEATLVDALLAKQEAEIVVQRARVNWEYVTGQQQLVQIAE